MARKVVFSVQQTFSSVSAGLVRAPDRWHRAERKLTADKASKVASCLDVELEGEDNFLFVNKQICNLFFGVQLEIFNFLNAKGVKLADDVGIPGKIVALKPVFDFFTTCHV